MMALILGNAHIYWDPTFTSPDANVRHALLKCVCIAAFAQGRSWCETFRLRTVEVRIASAPYGERLK